MNPASTKTDNKKKPVLLAASRQVAVAHRWLGIAIGFMFGVWFATGTVLSFVPFPVLEARDRISGSEAIDLEKVQVAPATAIAAAGTSPIGHFRLISVAGQPRYVLSLSGQAVVSVSAANGRPLGPLPLDDARTVAERFSGHKVVRSEGPFEYDQWTVHDRYDPHRPYFRFRVDDDLDTSIYVSARSGEVMQRTRLNERAWNRVGAIIHWLNPTILRKHDGVWHWTIWSIALAGITLISAGLWLGVVRYVNLKRMRRPGLSPFTGWLRWHHTIGLFAAVIVLNWISSGWLSLDRGTFFSPDQPSIQQLERLRGISLAEATRAFPLAHLRNLGAAREIEFTALGGQPLIVVRDRAPQFSRLLSVGDAGALNASPVIPNELLLSAVRSAWSPVGVLGIDEIADDDAYRLRTVPWPETARRVVLDDAEHTWVQIDAASGQIVSIMDTSRRVHRWVVGGPHNLDFPVFNNAGPLRHILILMATTTGFLFSCTGIVLATKRLRRSLSG